MSGIEHKECEDFFQRQYRFLLGMEAHEINCQVLEYFIFCNLRIAVDWNSAECLPYLGWQLLELIWQDLTSREIAAHNVCRLITIITRSCRIVPDPQIET